MFLLPKKYWEVKETAQKGRGVFARQDIPAGAIIGDYLGKLIYQKDFDEAKEGLFDMWFNEKISVLADPKKIGIHLINHSCSSNCDMYPYKGHMLFFATRHIFKGEELSVQYLLPPPDKNHICNHTCYCNSLVCHGTMHTSIEIENKADIFIQKLDGKYRKVPPVSIGSELPRLETYPRQVADDPIYDIFGSLEQKPLVCPDAVMPSIKKLRQLLREKGKVLYFKNFKTYVFGIMNGLVMCMTTFPQAN